MLRLIKHKISRRYNHKEYLSLFIASEMLFFKLSSAIWNWNGHYSICKLIHRVIGSLIEDIP